MKSGGYLQRNSTLKSYTPLKAKKGFSKTHSPLRRTSFDTSTSTLTPQKKLDKIVSLVIRMGSADSAGMVKCVTCGVIKHWKEMQCGHFQKRGNMATRYNMKNLGPQCETCNCFHDGEEKKFAEFIDGFYGAGTANQLRKEAQTIVHGFPYEQEIIKWQAVLAQLIAEHDDAIQY